VTGEETFLVFFFILSLMARMKVTPRSLGKYQVDVQELSDGSLLNLG